MGKVNRPPSKYKATRRPMPDFRPERDAIMHKVELYSEARENGCREWIAGKNELGYASVWWAKRYWMAHRLVYCAYQGPFDPWLDVRHSCDNPACIEIGHLSLGTRSDNMRDAVDRRRSKNAKKTHCPKGHAYAEFGEEFVPNTRHYKVWRRCKECHRIRSRERWHNDPQYRERRNELRRVRRESVSNG